VVLFAFDCEETFVMRIIVSALLALSVLASVAAPASGVDWQELYEPDRSKF